ncbi:unnamed protein product [Mytilus coruscus]|uniref:Uncharacterized protein n=1 Tax=Mytilus coruscus TaxID=42192 RepID=A0A6J8EPC4_MYTCO|nr:unnamed protein product [Mytilus coruscus]
MKAVINSFIRFSKTKKKIYSYNFKCSNIHGLTLRPKVSMYNENTYIKVGSNQPITQESNFSSRSEFVPTGLRYRHVINGDYIFVNQFQVPLQIHVQSNTVSTHTIVYTAAEDQCVPCGIVYTYQSTEPYDGRNRSNQPITQESNFSSRSEFVPTGLRYRPVINGDYIFVNQFQVPLLIHVHSNTVSTHTIVYTAAEDQCVPCGIVYTYQSTEPYDGRNRSNQPITQESNFSSRSEFVPTGLRYRHVINGDYIFVNQFQVPLLIHVHSNTVSTHTIVYTAAEDQCVPCGIVYTYQSTEPYDGRNSKLILLRFNRRKRNRRNNKTSLNNLGSNQPITQESNFSSRSEFVPTGLRYRHVINGDYIFVNQFQVPLQIHVQSNTVSTHTIVYTAAEDQCVPCGIVYTYQSTEPYDGRNSKLILPPIQQEKKGIEETTRHH